MARPVKWSRELPAIRERAARSRTETWSRRDIEHLFGVGRATAQSLMRAIGELQPVGGAHFVSRAALVAFLDRMAEAPTIEQALRTRLHEAEPPPRPKPLRVTLPADLRSAMLPDLPENVQLTPGRIEIEAPGAEAMLEALMRLALVMQNDDRWRDLVELPASPPPARDEGWGNNDELEGWLADLRARHAGPKAASSPKDAVP